MVAKIVSHPYIPKDLHLPHYVPNEKGLLEILGPFFGFVAVALGLTWMYTGTVHVDLFLNICTCFFLAVCHALI